jgi:hypothetical protein
MLKKTLLAVAMSSAMAVGAQAAQTIDFSSGFYPFTGIGGEVENSEFDKLYYDGSAETGFDVSVPVEFTVASLAMVVGDTCYVDTCVTPLSYDKSIDFTVNGQTKAFNLGFKWEISEADDRITFSQPSSLSFVLAGGAKLSIDFLTPDALIVPADSLEHRAFSSVKAKFSVTPAVPEPATYAMLLAGLAVVGAVARRKSA